MHTGLQKCIFLCVPLMRNKSIFLCTFFLLVSTKVCLLVKVGGRDWVSHQRVWEADCRHHESQALAALQQVQNRVPKRCQKRVPVPKWFKNRVPKSELRARVLLASPAKSCWRHHRCSACETSHCRSDSNLYNICCPRDCVSRHKGGTSGAPLKPLRVDSALRSCLN